MISTEQRIIIKQICEEQKESMLDVRENFCYEIFNDLHDDGFEVSIEGVRDECDRIAGLWMKVKAKPEKFMEILDDQQASMLKHHLVNKFEENYHGKGIWKTINIFERMKKYERAGGSN